jgi:pre-rRNA-processing protein TSR3
MDVELLRASEMKSVTSGTPRIFTLELKQDDPTKCTSAKMRKLGFARPISVGRIQENSIVLNPFAKKVILRSDSENAQGHGLVVIDCSWVKAVGVFGKKYKGEQRKLPALIAGNPTNYSKLWSLSSVEAAAAALHIMNFYDAAFRLLRIYKWGETFLTLNRSALDDYSQADSEEEVVEIEKSYFPQAFAESDARKP